METGLVKYDAMCRAIGAAHRVDEVKELRNKARALEVYAQVARNKQAEHKAAEIRIRAERRGGQLLKERALNGNKHRGGRPNKNRSNGPTGFKPETLTQLGISKTESSQWQQLADIPDEEFEQELAAPDVPNTEGILNSRILAETPLPPIDKQTVWLWGRLCDFERDAILTRDPLQMLNAMTDPMREDTLRLVPTVVEWLKGFMR